MIAPSIHTKTLQPTTKQKAKKAKKERKKGKHLNFICAIRIACAMKRPCFSDLALNDLQWVTITITLPLPTVNCPMHILRLRMRDVVTSQRHRTVSVFAKVHKVLVVNHPCAPFTTYLLPTRHLHGVLKLCSLIATLELNSTKKATTTKALRTQLCQSLSHQCHFAPTTRLARDASLLTRRRSLRPATSSTQSR